jgi:hypothetical protein
VALSLSGLGAIVLTAVPPPIPKRPASGTRPRVVLPANTQGPEEAAIAGVATSAGITRIAGIAGVAEMTEIEIEISQPAIEVEIEVELDLSEFEAFMRPPMRR